MILAIIIAALVMTVILAGGALVAGFVAAMPDGTLAYGITPRIRLELYLLAAATLFLEGQVWLSIAHP